MTRFFAALCLCSALAGPALANCPIENTTGTSFTIKSGNTSNQRVGGHTTTTIDHGTIVMVADGNKGGGGGACAKDQPVKIIEAGGGFAVVPK